MGEGLKYGTYYHIYHRGNNRENIFFEERNYAYFLKLYGKYIVPVADTFAYCLMRNHFHLVVRIKTVGEQEAWQKDHHLAGFRKRSRPPTFRRKDPSRQFSNLFNAYTKSINKAYHRTGALFESPFGRIVVNDATYFAQLVLYIHQNPQKHGFVDDFRMWPHSSYQTLLSKKSTHLRREEVLTWFGSLATAQTAHHHPISEKNLAPLIRDDFF